MLIQEIREDKCSGNFKIEFAAKHDVDSFAELSSAESRWLYQKQNHKCSGIFEIKFAAKLGLDSFVKLSAAKLCWLDPKKNQ